LSTSSKVRNFAKLEDVLAFILKLQNWEKTRCGPLHARLDERDDRGRWRERKLPPLAEHWANGAGSGWPK
jgi:hypothetical protein